ncbi:hypothetical protein AB9T88_15975, partial [Flavobacterium sp. LBUM151]
MDEAFTGSFLKNGALSNYGFGWRISKNKQQKLVEHSGSQFGYRTFIKRNLTQHNSYILLTNNGDAIALNEINLAIDNILSATPYVLPKIPVFSKLQEYLKINTTDYAIEMTRKALKETPDAFVIDDDGIDELAYKYVNDKKVDEGLALFKFNAEIN